MDELPNNLQPTEPQPEVPQETPPLQQPNPEQQFSQPDPQQSPNTFPSQVTETTTTTTKTTIKTLITKWWFWLIIALIVIGVGVGGWSIVQSVKGGSSKTSDVGSSISSSTKTSNCTEQNYDFKYTISNMDKQKTDDPKVTYYPDLASIKKTLKVVKINDTNLQVLDSENSVNCGSTGYLSAPLNRMYLIGQGFDDYNKNFMSFSISYTDQYEMKGVCSKCSESGFTKDAVIESFNLQIPNSTDSNDVDVPDPNTIILNGCNKDNVLMCQLTKYIRVKYNGTYHYYVASAVYMDSINKPYGSTFTLSEESKSLVRYIIDNFKAV